MESVWPPTLCIFQKCVLQREEETLFFCDFYYYQKLHLSWKFHRNCSSRSEDFLKLTLSPPFPRKNYLQKDQPYFNAQEKLFFSIKYNSLLKWSLAASGLFHMLTYKFYTFYCHILRSADVWKRWLIKEIENKKLFLSVSFTAKFELSFALTQENCIFLEVSF